jgi:hypothetical protein
VLRLDDDIDSFMARDAAGATGPEGRHGVGMLMSAFCSMELSSQLYEVARSADELEEQRRLGRDASTLLLVEQLQSQTDSLPHATLS